MNARVTSWLLAPALLLFTPVRAHAQALATATGPGSSVVVGGGLSGFQTDYGHNRIAGGFAFVDVNPHWRWGFEGESRFLRWHADEQVTESTYVGGFRLNIWPTPRHWSPYAKVLVGAGEITLPYSYAHGGFLTYAAGAGLDIALGDRIAARVVDFECQRWRQFSYGALSPYGVSAGFSFRLNGVSRYPKGARVRQ